MRDRHSVIRRAQRSGDIFAISLAHRPFSLSRCLNEVPNLGDSVNESSASHFSLHSPLRGRKSYFCGLSQHPGLRLVKDRRNDAHVKKPPLMLHIDRSTSEEQSVFPKSVPARLDPTPDLA